MALPMRLPSERRGLAWAGAWRGRGAARRARGRRAGGRGRRLAWRQPPGGLGRAAGQRPRGRVGGGHGRLLAREPCAQRDGELAGGRVAKARVALEGSQDRRRQGLGDRGVVGARRQRPLVLAADGQLGEGRALPGKAPREELVDDDAERVDVRGRRGLLAARLLGSQIGGRADHGPDLGQARLLGRPRDPEVGQLHRHLSRGRVVGGGGSVAAPRGTADHHQVPGLDVAVDDPLPVRVLEPGARLGADLDRDLGREPTLRLEELGARAALHVLHDDVVTVVVDAGVVDLDDVRVDQLRHRQRLAAEAGDELLVVREVLGQDLHGHRALQDAVGRLVDARHPARPEAVAELVAVGDQGRAHALLIVPVAGPPRCRRSRRPGPGAVAVRAVRCRRRRPPPSSSVVGRRVVVVVVGPWWSSPWWSSVEVLVGVLDVGALRRRGRLGRGALAVHQRCAGSRAAS